MSEPRLHIALQKSGRLAEKSLDLIEKAGFRILRGPNGLFSKVENAPIDLLFVRDDDIPVLVRDGVADLGIIGRNVLAERAKGGERAPEEVMALGFGRCSLKLAGPSSFKYEGPQSLNQLRIATSYPAILAAYLKSNGVQAEIVTMRGSVEAAPRLKLANLIFDLVSTGATLEVNGLNAFATVMASEAVLIRSSKNANQDMAHLADTVIARFRGVTASEGAKYVMMNAPRSALKKISDILPGAGAPTVTPLAGCEDGVAVHAVCQENIFWETLEELKAAGASAILVLPIEKML